MMRTGYQQKERSKEDVIIEAATRLFLSKGFSGVSMEEIAKGSSVAKQTLYSYFKGKDDLFRAIIHAQAEDFFAMLPRNDDPSVSIEEFLYQVGKSAMNMLFTRDTLELYRLAVAETPRFPEIGELYWQTGPQALIERMVEFLKNHGLTEDSAEKASEQFLSLIVGHMLSLALLRKNYHPTRKEKEEHVAQAVSIFFKINKYRDKERQAP
jgi:TetR/AcrR family transcriptional repressor of mexJK operon